MYYSKLLQRDYKHCLKQFNYLYNTISKRLILTIEDNMLLDRNRISQTINTVQHKNKTLILPTSEYSWQKWNCFHLADHIRQEFGLEPLPDVSNIWKKYYLQENQAPKDLVKNTIWQFCLRTLEPKNFNLCLLRFDATDNLGTVLDGKVIFIGHNQASIMPLHRVTQYIDSVWQYVPGV